MTRLQRRLKFHNQRPTPPGPWCNPEEYVLWSMARLEITHRAGYEHPDYVFYTPREFPAARIVRENHASFTVQIIVGRRIETQIISVRCNSRIPPRAQRAAECVIRFLKQLEQRP